MNNNADNIAADYFDATALAKKCGAHSNRMSASAFIRLKAIRKWLEEHPTGSIVKHTKRGNNLSYKHIFLPVDLMTPLERWCYGVNTKELFSDDTAITTKLVLLEHFPHFNHFPSSNVRYYNLVVTAKYFELDKFSEYRKPPLDLRIKESSGVVMGARDVLRNIEEMIGVRLDSPDEAVYLTGTDLSLIKGVIKKYA